jgi:exonuclease VII small subunit
MRAVSEYRQRAQECRELARMVHKLEDKYALDHAAQSWERLAARCEHEAED